jgi:hypothetical protein
MVLKESSKSAAGSALKIVELNTQVDAALIYTVAAAALKS